MSTKRLKLVLSEIGDLQKIPIYPYKNNEFITDEGWKVKVGLEPIPEDYMDGFNLPSYIKHPHNVFYTIEGEGGQYTKSTYKELIKIIKTVSSIIEDELHENPKIDAILIMAENKDSYKSSWEADPQKSKLYKAVVLARISKNFGWAIKNVEVGSIESFIMYKKRK
jgi:hypothetical protein